MNKLTAEQIISLNKKIVGEHYVAPDEECMAAVAQIANAPYQKEKLFLYKHRDMIDRANVLGSELLRHMPFRDENGKTALLAVLTMLELNGYELHRDNEDIAELYHILRGAHAARFRDWVCEHMEEITK